MSTLADPPTIDLKDFDPPELSLDDTGLPIVPDNFGTPEPTPEIEPTPEPPAPELETPPTPPAEVDTPAPKAEAEPTTPDDALAALLAPVDTPDDLNGLADKLETAAPEDRKQANKWYRSAIDGVREKFEKQIEDTKAAQNKAVQELEAERAKIASRQAEFESRELEYASAVPDSHPEIKAITDGFSARWSEALKSIAISADDPSKVSLLSSLDSAKKLVGAYTALDPSDPNFTANRDSIRSQIDEAIGGGTFDRLVPTLQQGADAFRQLEAKTADLQLKAGSAAYERQMEAHGALASRVDSIVKTTWGKVPEDIHQTAPFSADAIVDQFAKASPEIQERFDKLREVLPSHHLPLAPPDPTELAAMAPDQKEAYLQQRESQHASRVDALIARSYKHHALEIVAPLMAKKIKDLEDMVSDITGDEPVPQAGGHEDNTDTPEAKATTLADFLENPDAGLEKHMADAGFADNNAKYGIR